MLICPVQRLLKLKVGDIYELTDTRLEGDVIMDAIIELKKRDVSLSASQHILTSA